MKILPLKIDKLITPKDDIIEIIKYALSINGIKPRTGDVLAVSIKIVSITRNNIYRLDDIKPREEALRIGERFKMDPRVVELIMREGGRIIGGVEGALATIMKGYLVGNAGIDRKNVMKGWVAIWPKDPDKVAGEIRIELEKIYGEKLGVVLVDSRVNPLRIGTVGFAVGASGIAPLKDYRDKEDLFGKRIRFTRQNILDELASAAHLLMGEGVEMTPIAYIEEPPIQLCEECTSMETLISPSRCLYMNRIERLLDYID
jgi:coenzyme F420-0:L-glutamate ligase